MLSMQNQTYVYESSYFCIRPLAIQHVNKVGRMVESRVRVDDLKTFAMKCGHRYCADCYRH